MRSRLLSGLGTLLLLCGLGVGGYVLWQLYGTDLVAGRSQESLRRDVKQAWQAGKETEPGVVLVRIPRFGDDWEKPVLTGLDDSVLSRSVGRDPANAEPGEIGNLVLAGHRVTHGSPFRRFLDLRAGDVVEVETRDAVHTYRLREDGHRTRVDFSATWPLQPVPEPGAGRERPSEALLTLITCSEIFHTDDRSVVTGVLVETHPKTS